MASYDATSRRFQLRVTGRAMVRYDGTGFPPGCYITIDPLRTPVAGDYVVADLGEDDVKAFGLLSASLGDAGDQPRLEFLNPEFDLIALPSHAAILGVVCERELVEFF